MNKKMEERDAVIGMSRHADSNSKDMMGASNSNTIYPTDQPEMSSASRHSAADHMRAAEMHKMAAEGMKKMGNAPLADHHTKMHDTHMKHANEQVDVAALKSLWNDDLGVEAEDIRAAVTLAEKMRFERVGVGMTEKISDRRILKAARGARDER